MTQPQPTRPDPGRYENERSQRQVRVTSYRRGDGTTVRGYTQNRDSAKGEWDIKKWQAATAGASVAIALAVGLATILGLVSEIVFAILLLALLGLNAAVKALTNPRPKPAVGRKRTTTTRHVVRRRGPARKTVRRR